MITTYPPTKTPGVQPLTVVDSDKTISLDELAKRIEKTRNEHGEILQQYHEVWYQAPHTWHYTHFLGVGMMKCPNDLWIYQALMSDHRPKYVIETGTYSGASALWFAFLMDALNIEGGRVFTVDFEDHRRCRHPRITFLGGDSANPKLVASIAEELDDESPRLISLDSDHSTEHVYNELTLCAPLCRPGDWLVVEDTNIGWSDGKAHIITSYGGVAECTCGARWAYSERLLDPPKTCPNNHSNRGARGGLEDYLNEHPGEFRQDIICERYLLSMNPGGWLQRVAECRHA